MAEKLYTGTTPWIVCIWPDGTWCNLSDLEEFLTVRSDDYSKESVISYDEAYVPVKTVKL